MECGSQSIFTNGGGVKMVLGEFGYQLCRSRRAWERLRSHFSRLRFHWSPAPIVGVVPDPCLLICNTTPHLHLGKAKHTRQYQSSPTTNLYAVYQMTLQDSARRNWARRSLPRNRARKNGTCRSYVVKLTLHARDVTAV